MLTSLVIWQNRLQLNNKKHNTGIVIKSTGSNYQVEYDNNKIINCKIRGKFRIKGISTTNPVAVGDSVDFLINDDNEGIIIKINQRKNYIIRRSTNLSKQHQIIASNIDNAFLVITLFNPETTSEFIDRFLVTTEAYKIKTILIFNKLDLYNSEQEKYLDNFIDIYKTAGYKYIKTSVKTNLNIDKLKLLTANKINVFSGHSGTGKSSLINCLDNTLNLKTGEISTYHQKGKHTTTFAQMHKINNGGYIIDTPGIKAFGIIDDIKKEDLSKYFPEIFKFSKKCKFNNCTHYHEPDCAVKEAVENEKISVNRYNNYLNILLDEKNKHRL